MLNRRKQITEENESLIQPRPKKVENDTYLYFYQNWFKFNYNKFEPLSVS